MRNSFMYICGLGNGWECWWTRMFLDEIYIVVNQYWKSGLWLAWHCIKDQWCCGQNPRKIWQLPYESSSILRYSTYGHHPVTGKVSEFQCTKSAVRIVADWWLRSLDFFATRKSHEIARNARIFIEMLPSGVVDGVLRCSSWDDDPLQCERCHGKAQ